MTEVMDREKIESTREDLLDKLSFAKQRRKQVAGSAALSGDEKALTEADECVRKLELKLEGLGYMAEQLTAQERERREAERLARRREAAVEVWSLVNQRYWATEAYDMAMAVAEGEKRRIENLADKIKFVAKDWFHVDDNRAQENFRSFLLNIDAYGMADTSYRIRHGGLLGSGLSTGLPLARPAALRALATGLPEVEDEAVREEAGERAQRESGAGAESTA